MTSPGSATPEAEREGFEPSRELAPPTRLAGECLQPLGHLSGAGADSRNYRRRPRPAPGGAARRYARAAMSATETATPSIPMSRPSGAFRPLRGDLRIGLAAVRVRRPRRAAAPTRASCWPQAAGKPIRIASSRCARWSSFAGSSSSTPAFAGILAYTLPEALWLPGQGFDDIVVAYPTADREALAQLVEAAADDPGRAPVPMVDAPPHLDLIEAAIHGGAAEVRVCLDLDVGWWPARGSLARIGPKRSPVRTPEAARRMAAEISERPGTRLAGVMAYEGHIAGVGDRIPGRPLRSAAIRWMQARLRAGHPSSPTPHRGCRPRARASSSS